MQNLQGIRQLIARLTTALVLGLCVGVLSLPSAQASTLTINANVSNLSLINITTSPGPLPIQVLSGNVYAGSIVPASLDNTPLPFLYCVDMLHDIYVPGTYNASITFDGTVHGTAVAHADQVAWLLDQYATSASGNATQTAALQAAIWEVIYGDQFTLNGAQAILNQAALYLTNVGTASVENYTWISPVSGNERMQGLVTRVPEPSSTLLLGFALVGLICVTWWRARRTPGSLHAS